MKRSILVLVAFLVLAPTLVFAGANPARQAAATRGTESPADGPWDVYDRNGVLTRQENYRSYRLEGETRYFYPSGGVKATYIYSDSKRQGPSRTYYENGALESESTYVDNNFEGISRHFYDTGELESVSNYANGNLAGERKYYSKNGVVIKIANYKDGVLNGTVVTYNEAGQVTVEEQFRNAVLIARKEMTSENLNSTLQGKPAVATKKAIPPPPAPESPQLTPPSVIQDAKDVKAADKK